MGGNDAKKGPNDALAVTGGIAEKEEFLARFRIEGREGVEINAAQ
ncbi:hypothetical protein VAWG006_37750 [Aeromonas enteropelogenes]|nr:hypothetical protein VAWG006_37750 [Aeromonas enteropelogenes]BEE23685.1 hypothetical protein VAWG007_37800 [Aeromonas enteropelogenes]